MSRDLILVAIAMFTLGIGEGLFFYFQPIYLQEMGADPISIGAILGGSGLMMTISHIPAGYLADRIGRKPVMITGWVMAFISAWIMFLATTLPIFVAGVLLYGMTLFVVSPIFSYVTAARGRWSVGRAITSISACFNLGAVIGPWLGGQISDQFGLRQTYFIAALIFMASTAIVLFIRAQPIESHSSEDDGNSWLLNPRYLTFLGVVFLAVFATYFPQTFSPNFLQNQRGLTLAQIGSLYSVSGIGVVMLNLILGQLPARVGFLLGQVAVGMFALLIMQGTGLPWYMMGFFLLGGYKTTRILASAQVRELVSQAKMGLAFGITETIGSTATILAPILAGYLYSREPVWIYIAGIGLVCISVLLSVFFPPVPKDSDTTSERKDAYPHNPIT